MVFIIIWWLFMCLFILEANKIKRKMNLVNINNGIVFSQPVGWEKQIN